ncbi:uncharacterized protein LOC128231218 [Mya arenaria]|uniref:uncharacterized protein LOC128231218 n=1 Tax=Mya arenaria TaxID=6604 RepID=UPI0022E072CB|nr:uncharacterized protein LOC128231218 [Mya arenaria]
MVVLNDRTPMVQTRVLYIGSAVPLETVEGLEAIQAPLRERYPVNDDATLEGIDAMLSISNSNIQLMYMGDSDHVIQFPISALTLCAAVRCVTTVNGVTGENQARFVSLQDPLAGGRNSHRPAIFTAVTRRTQGRKVLECHGFVCANAKDALNLVKCARVAGMNFKRNGSVAAATPRQTTVNGAVRANGGVSSNRLSTEYRTTTVNADGSAMRLIPGEPVAQNITAGPEFYEPVSAQGYFYSSSNAEVKKFNILRQGGIEPQPKSSPYATANMNGANGEATPVNGTTPVNGESPSPSPRPKGVSTAPPPIYIRLPRNGPPPPQFYGPRPPVYYGPPPPSQFILRPRFFSPPPPRMRPHPFAMPPGGPQPMYAAPIYMRRPRRGSQGSSGSRSKSHSSSRSRGSRERSNTPTRDINGGENTEPKRRIPNADESSDDSDHRPSTPPKDYDKRNKRGQRQSRRDAYEVRYGLDGPHRMAGPPPPEMMPPYHGAPYDYYVHPPRHGGYAPFPMYNPHGRARSLPPENRHRSKSPKKSKKKHKKNRKHKHHKQRVIYSPPGPYPVQPQYGPYPHQSDLSQDSVAGYHSEIPRRRPDVAGYEFYPPRDFRRDENQFMNERHFSQSIAKETRRSRDSRSYPTAYELNDALDRDAMKQNQNDEAEFNLY